MPAGNFNRILTLLRKERGITQKEAAAHLGVSQALLSHYEKGITYSEFLQVLNELSETGFVTRSWFNKNLSECAKEGSCNFTSLCGILELLGYCKYSEKGKYEAVKI